MSNRYLMVLVLLCTGLASCASDGSFRSVDAKATGAISSIRSADLWPFGGDDESAAATNEQAAQETDTAEAEAEQAAPEPVTEVAEPAEPVKPVAQKKTTAPAPDVESSGQTSSDLQRVLSEQKSRATANDQSKAIESKVVQSWLASAQTGNPLAQVVVASLYENGSGVDRNLGEAVNWYRKAANQSYHRGEHHLGRMYHFGLGVPEDDAESGRWLRRAADQGDAQAQGLLALLYLEGRGVPQNYQQAYLWASVAATGDAQRARVRDEALIAQYSEGIQRELRAETARQNQEVQQWAKDIREAAARQLPPEKLTEAQQLAASQWERLNGTTAPVVAPVSNRRKAR